MARILVVDDDPDFQEFLSVLLELEGYEVLAAYDGQSALDVINQGRAPDLVLLDVLMPGMDGFEVCMALLADPAKSPPPVVFISALADDKHIRQGLSMGGVHYITKPLDVVELLATIKDVLAETGKSADAQGKPDAEAEALAEVELEAKDPEADASKPGGPSAPAKS